MVFVLMRADRATRSPRRSVAVSPPSSSHERRAEAGYDRPIIVQYLEYLGQVFTGNFGTTLTDNQPVVEVLDALRRGDARAGLLRPDRRVHRRHPARHGRCGDAATVGATRSLRIFAILCYATPVFFSGLLLKLVFSVWLGWLPVAGRASRPHGARPRPPGRRHGHLPHRRDPLRQPADLLRRAPARHPPGIALGLLTAGIFLRLVRTNVIGTLSMPYVDAARSRGRAASAGWSASTPASPRSSRSSRSSACRSPCCSAAPC